MAMNVKRIKKIQNEKGHQIQNRLHKNARLLLNIQSIEQQGRRIIGPYRYFISNRFEYVSKHFRHK